MLAHAMVSAINGSALLHLLPDPFLTRKALKEMSGAQTVYIRLISPEDIERVVDGVILGLQPLIEAIPASNASAIAGAVRSALDASFTRISQELHTMSDLSAQIAADVQLLKDNTVRIRDDVEAVVAQLQAGNPVTQEQVTALNNAVSGLSGVVDTLDAVATPNPPPP